MAKLLFYCSKKNFSATIFLLMILFMFSTVHGNRVFAQFNPVKLSVPVAANGTGAVTNAAAPLLNKDYNNTVSVQAGTLVTSLPTTASTGMRSNEQAVPATPVISGTLCAGSTLTVSPTNGIASLTWNLNGTPVLTVNNTWVTIGSTVAGGNGQGINATRLTSPRGVYIDGSGNVYVADLGNHRIQRWAPGATTGTTVAGGNGFGGNANQLYSPAGVYVDGSGNVYVADYSNHRIQRWAPGATSGTTVAGGNGYGVNANQLACPFGVYVDGSGNVYVADYFNHRIQRWAPGATSGTTVAGGNGQGINANQLSNPTGVYVDGSGNIYVADFNNHRIQRWAAGTNTGTTVAGGNGQGVNANQLNRPISVYVDGSGNVYVADRDNHRVQRWAPGASTGSTLAGGNGQGGNANQLASPRGVYVDGSGNMYVADSDNHRIQRFTPVINNSLTNALVGTYTVTVTSFTGSSVSSAPVTVNDHSTISLSSAPGTNLQTLCNNNAITGITYAIGGAGTGASITAGGLPAGVTGSFASGVFTISGTPVASGVFPYTVTTTGSGCEASMNGTITVNDNSTISLSSAAGTDAQTVCINSPMVTITYAIGGGGTGATITSGTLPAGVTGSYAAGVFTISGMPTAPGNFSYQLTTTGPCLNAAISGMITVNTLPGASFTGLAGPYCADAAVVSLTSTQTGGIFSGPGVTDNADGTATFNASAAGAGTHSITYIYTDGNGCTNSSVQSVTVNATTSSSSTQNKTICSQELPYTWDGLTFAAAGTQIKTGLNNAAGCDSTVIYNLMINALPATPIISGGLCAGSTLTVSPVNGLSSLVWNLNGTPLSMVSNIAGSTVAGGNGPGGNANQFNEPSGVYVDGSGNVYVADQYNYRIQRWAPGATTGTTVAGGNDRGGNANQLAFPSGVYVDGSGNVYVADAGNNRIQRWAPGASSGTTVAGGNGPGGNANQFESPRGVYIDGSGNVYVADMVNHRIQRWAPGAITGTTVAGGNGPGGNANQLNRPHGVYVDGSGNVYVADLENHRIQRWAPGATSGITVAGGNGPGGNANQLNNPIGVYVYGSGNVYVADLENHRIQCWAPGATAGSTVAGGNCPGGNANQFSFPFGVYVDGSGNMYVADNYNERIQRFTPAIKDSLPNTIAGTYTVTVTGLNGCNVSSAPVIVYATSSTQNSSICINELPYTWDGLTFTATGTQTKTGLTNAGGCDSTATYNLTVNEVNASPATPIISGSLCAGSTLTVSPANGLSSLVWNLNGTPVSTVSNTWNTIGSTVAGGNEQGGNANQLNNPCGVYVDGSGNVYVADYNNHRIQRWAPGATSGITVAGGNGPGGNANQLVYPTGVYMDGSGNVYVADNYNHRIQRWAPGATSGTTVAGGNGEGGNANQLNSPFGVYVDGSGNVYVADQGNQRIQRWAPGATTGTTVAGGNGFGRNANQFRGPTGVYVDEFGFVYVADEGNDRVQRWAPGATTGITVAGSNCQGENASQLNRPFGVYVDRSGNVYVADFYNNRIQRWAPGATSGTTVAGGNGFGGNANQLRWPTGVYVDGSGNVYVADYSNHRIQRFTSVINNSLLNLGAGTYTVTVTGFTGCSVSSAPVTVNTTTPTSSIQNKTICSNELPYTWDGLTFTVAGTQIKTGLFNAVGCDSTAIYNLTANATTSSYHSRTICSNGLPYTWDGLTFAAAGTQTKTGFTNAAGCDSTATYNLTVNALPDIPIISGTLCAGSTLTISPTNGIASLTWNLNGTPISTVGNTWNTTGSTVAGGNGPGGNANQLNDTWAVYVDVSGNVYVVDVYNFRIQRWAPGATTGTTVAGGNGQGGNANQLNFPNGVYVDGSGNVYVTDEDNHRIQRWAPGATSGTTVAGGNGSGANANQLKGPWGVYLDGSGNLYTADRHNHRIQRWAPGATSGTTVAGGNGLGENANQLNYPAGVYVDVSGNIYVSDYSNNRIQRWSPGADTGITVAGGNGQGGNANQFDWPFGIYVDITGKVYVADVGNNRIQRWSPGADTGITVAGGNGQGGNANQLADPVGIHMDGSGNLYVADGDNHRIQRFAPIINDSLPNAGAGTYTVTVTGFTGCSVSSAPVTVYTNSTISLSSAPGTDAQTVCNNNAITGITYAIGGAGTGASITAGALPAGVTGSFALGIFTISGTPTASGNFTYTVTTTGPCVNTSISGTINVLALPTVSFTGLGAAYCTTDASVTLTGTPAGGSFSGPGISGSSFDPAAAGAGIHGITYTYTDGNGCTNSNSQNVTVTICATFTTLNLTTFLEGYYYDINTMRANIFDLGISTDLTETDTVTVNLWSPASLSNAEPDHSVRAVVHTDGTATMQFPAAVTGNSFYIAVKHRNHLETWSKLPVTFTSTTAYDFSNSLSQAYDDGINPPMASVAGGKFAFYGGDVNQDGTVDASDMAEVDNDNAIFAFGYNTTEISGDGATDASDISKVDNNQALFLFYARPY